MKKQYSILLDIGGTDIKVAVSDLENSNLVEVQRYSTPKFLKLEKFKMEISPNEIIEICNLALSTIKSKYGTIEILAISGQMGCWLLTDKENRPITNIISWQDKRSDEYDDCGRTFRENSKLEFGGNSISSAGNEDRVGLPIFGLYTLLESSSLSSGMRFHSLISWVTSQLVREYRHIVHETDFASSGMYDIYSRKILKEAERYFSNKIEFPEISSKIEIIGSSKMEFFPVLIGVGDQQASLLGSGIDSNSVVVNIGTGGQVADLVLDKPFNPNLQVRPFFNQSYIHTRTHLPAGRIITEYLAKLYGTYFNNDSYFYFYNLGIENLTEYEARGFSNVNDDLSKISENERTKNSDKIMTEVIMGYFIAYRNALDEILLESPQQILFAGGVGQKFVTLQNLLKGYFQTRIQIASTEESTLQGLAYITSNFIQN